MNKLLAALLTCGLIGLVAPDSARSESASGLASAPEPSPAAVPEPKTLGHKLVFWIPNRVFDVLDLVRFRVRAGPGFTLGVRATELADVNLGAHATVWAGLHGPRKDPQIPWPVGLETYTGIEVSVADVGTEEARFGPQYGPLECGVSTHLALLGFDLGVEPYDALDLVLGILTLDPKGDDF